MSGDEFDRRIDQALSGRIRQNQLRQRLTVTPLDATHIRLGDLQLVNFASNDYLGLSRHPRVRAAAIAAIDRYGTGSGASALISGYTELHSALEADLATWKGCESAVLLPSGYQANLAAVQAAAAISGGGNSATAGESPATGLDRPLRVLIDKLVHASIIDAMRVSGSPHRVFPHNGLEKLDRLLRQGQQQFIDMVATESIYSMDGDAADLQAIARLRARQPFVWLLDDAHGSGIFGALGRGPADSASARPDIFIVTFSKALGCCGGAICGLSKFCQAVVNFSRAYIYSTSIAPPAVAAVAEALRVIRDEPQRANRLAELARHVRDALRDMSLEVPEGNSPIVPIILGSEEAAIAASRAFSAEGFYVPAVRPPTVAPGASRLRITLCSEHSDEEIECLLAACRKHLAGAADS